MTPIPWPTNRCACILHGNTHRTSVLLLRIAWISGESPGCKGLDSGPEGTVKYQNVLTSRGGRTSASLRQSLRCAAVTQQQGVQMAERDEGKVGTLPKELVGVDCPRCGFKIS